MKGDCHYDTSIPTCPYCNYEDEDYWDGMGERRYWGEFEEYECINCSKKYYLMREQVWQAKPSCDLNKVVCELEDMIIESPYKECTNCGELHKEKK